MILLFSQNNNSAAKTSIHISHHAKTGQIPTLSSSQQLFKPQVAKLKQFTDRVSGQRTVFGRVRLF